MMHALLFNALTILCIVVPLWLVSVWRKDVSIVDPFWSMLFLAVTVRTFVTSPAGTSKRVLLAMVALWALRLCLHLLWRLRGKAEDPRYTAFRQRFGPERYWWVSLFQVFLLQGALALGISAPLQLRMLSPGGTLGVLEFGAIGLFSVGFFIEALADKQLQSFRNDPAQRGRVLDTGLFRYSRHPNYFGETLIMWSFWLFAVNAPGGYATVFSPLLMTFLLLRVSGVSMLDAHLMRTRPGYDAYMRRTSSFVLWPPRS